MRFEKLGEDEESAIYLIVLDPADVWEGMEATGTVLHHFTAEFEAQLFKDCDRSQRWLMITRRDEGRVPAIDWLGRMLNGQPETDDPA